MWYLWPKKWSSDVWNIKTELQTSQTSYFWPKTELRTCWTLGKIEPFIPRLYASALIISMVYFQFFSGTKINLPIQLRHVSMPSCIRKSLNHLHIPSFYTQQKVEIVYDENTKKTYNKNECNQFGGFVRDHVLYISPKQKNILSQLVGKFLYGVFLLFTK